MNFVTGLTNTTYTQNGAVTNKSTLSACLDLFSMGVSASLDEKIILIEKALAEDIITAIKVVFYLRDCRGGQGNKDIMQALFKVKTLTQLIPFIAEYGSYKDLIKLYNQTNDHLKSAVTAYYVSRLIEKDNLAAKYAPRKGEFAKALTKTLLMTPKEYRQHIVSLSKTVEQEMCARKWSTINYKQVPSRANKLYAKAFARHDEGRYNDFLALVQRGDATMNSAQLYPHEILGMITHEYNKEAAANALWKSLPNYMEKAVNVLPIIDVSGSMGSIAYSKYTCLDIAVGLGMYFSEHNTGDYKDLWLQFADKPLVEKFTGDTLSKRFSSMNRNRWGGSTNLQGVFDFVLAHSNKENAPKIILIVSDMEFNSCTRYGTNMDNIRRKYDEAGIEMPVVVFWRVDVKVMQQPVIKSDLNTIVVNGYSPAFAKTLLAADLENITPLKMMHKAIAKYDFVDSLSF